MAVTRTPQEEIETRGSSIDDTLSPADHDANAIDLADTLDFMASQLADVLGEVAWQTAPNKSIATLAAQQTFEATNALRRLDLLTDITIPGAQNFKILSVVGSEVPAGKIKAIAGTQVGLVTVPHGGTFGTTHSVAEIAGLSTLSPKNLLLVWDGTTGDEIVSAGRRVYALLQNEAGATDATAFTDVTAERAQVSFVRPNATYDDLEACPVADIENKVVNLSFVERAKLSDWTEQDYLQEQVRIDLGAAGATVNLNNAIDNQGTTPATQQTNIFWRIDDATQLDFQTSDGAKNLLAIIPNIAGDEVEINVDTFDVNVGAAGVIDFDNGATLDSGGQAINVGVTAGQIDSTTLKLTATTGLAEVEGVGVTLDATTGNIVVDGVIGDLDFTDDSHLFMTANDAATKELRLAARNIGAGAGDLALEADDDIFFQTVRETTDLPLDDVTAGPISGLTGGTHASVSAAIAYAMTVGGVDLAFKKHILAGSVAQGVNMPAATLDLSLYQLDMDSGTFAVNPVFTFHNGRILVGDAISGGGDVYPGTTPASGDLKHDFNKAWKTGDVILSIGFKG